MTSLFASFSCCSNNSARGEKTLDIAGLEPEKLSVLVFEQDKEVEDGAVYTG